jgi:Reverse transcriptase (RNA-dependent DNA polymerase)
MIEAIFGDHGEEYWIAMKNEIEALVKRQTWDIMPRTQVPKGEPIVPGTWAFKCKRRPDGSFRKFKARWCVRGDVETRMNKGNTDTYSPVIQWSSVRLMLIFTILFDLHTRSIDFSNAFAQANMPADNNIYLEMPENFTANDKSDCVLKLKKSLYGSTIAPRLWYEKLKKGLVERKFEISSVDPCMFIRKDCIIQAYVDDLVIYAPKQVTIDQLLQSFHDDGDQYNWEMTIEGTIQEFLGINLTRRGNEWHLTQEGLIQSVLKTTGMLHCNSKSTPGSGDGKPLGSDKIGSLAREKWQYSSVVGMLMYLASNSRPDIAFAVHQCARFTHNTRASHEKALLRICSYLKGTQDKGLIFKPTFDNISVDCYVDADFLGLFGTEDSQDPISAKSRTGYVITLANCPLLWVSKLQTEIALSTCESEFVALSQAFRSLIPTKRLLEETLKGMQLPIQVHYQAKSTVFEDNAAALGLATTKKFTPRTRHMACKYFWFLEKVEQGLATIVKVESEKNMADIFTKNLGQIAFERVRLLLCGW